jgi:hypothetical protein
LLIDGQKFSFLPATPRPERCCWDKSDGGARSAPPSDFEKVLSVNRANLFRALYARHPLWVIDIV